MPAPEGGIPERQRQRAEHHGRGTYPDQEYAGYQQFQHQQRNTDNPPAPGTETVPEFNHHHITSRRSAG
ncbi:hypothetical protein D3C87_1752270 [compost metagenome]